jgi:8-oxo-dGTP pyrophosphatase MutT (NUDIX family)
MSGGKERFTVIPAIYILFKRADKILLIRRFNTGYQDGKYSLPAGHVDGGEPAEQAAAREALEEVGVRIKPEDLHFVHLMHRNVDSDDRYKLERADIFFEARKWDGEIVNCEPSKCDELRWEPLGDLPENTIPEVAHALNAIGRGEYYSSYNF